MKIYTEQGLNSFQPWSGASITYDRVAEAGKLDELETALEEIYPEGMSETELNDLLWFDDQWIYELLNMQDAENEDEDEEG